MCLPASVGLAEVPAQLSLLIQHAMEKDLDHRCPTALLLAQGLRKLAGTTGLCDTRASYQGSYPTSSALVRIPIDHVLVSCDVGVHDREIGPDVGSDHLPVVVDLVF